MTELTWILLICFGGIFLITMFPIFIHYLKHKNINIKHKNTEVNIKNEN